MEYGEGTDVFDLKEIKNSVDEKMKLFAHEDAIAADLKDFIAHEINGNDIKLVIKKKLQAGDLSRSQNRLMLPANQVETHEFLTPEEKKYMEDGKGLEVLLWGPTLQLHGKRMMLRIWRLKSSFNYVLMTNWNKFVKENEEVLKGNTKIHVWSFRRDGMLCFALACIDDVA